jgi:hypothetical protein
MYNKVAKEVMRGLLAGVEAWISRDHHAEWNKWLGWLENISKKATGVKGVSTKVTEPFDLNNRAPLLHISWDPSQLHITGAEVAEDFGRNKPRIAVGSRNEDGLTSITISPNQMQEGEDKIVADRVRDILSKKRSPKTDAMAIPAVDLTGRWEVEVAFFSSSSKHHWYLEQDGNWLNGLHQSDFASQDIYGTMEGNEVRLHSVFRQPGDHITYIFSGELSGEELKGKVHMGEYLAASFVATRREHTPRRNKIMVPAGSPLAT